MFRVVTSLTEVIMTKIKKFVDAKLTIWEMQNHQNSLAFKIIFNLSHCQGNCGASPKKVLFNILYYVRYWCFKCYKYKESSFVLYTILG